MQARYYDPVIGRFYSNDPAGFSNVHNFNRYAYANNNPYKYIDPDGQNALTAFGGLIHESGQFLQGNGFNGSMVMGALADGYNGEGSGFWAAAGEDALSFGGGIVGAAVKLGGFGKKAFDVASTFKGGKFKEVTLNPGTKLERAFEAGVTNPVGGFTTRGVTGQKLTSGQGASDVLALGGTSNAVPTHVSSLVVTQKTTAKMGFIAGSSNKNAVQIVVDNAQGALREVSRRGINQ
jgi:hypothetical protein